MKFMDWASAIIAAAIGLAVWTSWSNSPPARKASVAQTVSAVPKEEPFELPPSTESGEPLSDNSRIAAYQRVAESIDKKIAIANVVADCGIRSMDWYGATVRQLEAYRNGPRVAPLLMAMDREELREAQGWSMQITRRHERWLRPNGRSDCARIARLPFPYNDAAYLP